MDAEFQATPAPDRMEMCHSLAEAGVPIILCHHPHVPQGIEVHQGGLIVYSLGNYVFPVLPYMRSNSVDFAKSFHIVIEVDRKGPVSARIVPVTIDEDGRPLLAQGAARQEILEMVAERTRLLGERSEVTRRYREMVGVYTRQIFQNIYWAVGERDWDRIRTIFRGLAASPTKRGWILHFFRARLTGR